jgi:hypothetical protein
MILLKSLTFRHEPAGGPNVIGLFTIAKRSHCPTASEQMARKVFFSFHYERDAQRAAVVRNHAVTKDNDQAAGYLDKAAWESIERQGDPAIKNWISEQLSGTSVTVVLVGPETDSRPWVKYELQQSYARKNGLFAVTLHNIKDFSGNTDLAGSTNFGSLGKDKDGNDVYFFQIAKTYDWVSNDGYENFGKWVEDAATTASKR